ncbi:MAG: T9SS type A sorting domain-containing protein [Crocinitomicaceae bacterium]
MLSQIRNYVFFFVLGICNLAHSQEELVYTQETNEFVKSPGYSVEEGRKYNSEEFQSHPDFGKLTFSAPYGKNVVEDISKRTEYSRYYIDIEHPAYFYIEKASKPLNLEKDGFIRAIDPSLHKVANGIYQSGVQHYETSISQIAQSTKMNFKDEFIEFNNYLLKIVHNDNSVEFLNADWSSLEMTNFSGYVTNVFPGIDMSLEFGKGRIKSNFIIKQNLNVKEISFIDQIQLSSNLAVMLSDENPFEKVFLEIYNVQTSETEIVAQPAITYDNSGNRNSWISQFDLIDNDLYTTIDSAHLNDFNINYPITVDPTFIAVGPIANAGGIHGSVQVPGTCTDNIVVNFPGGSEPWDTQFTWNIYTQQCAGSFFLFGVNDACWLSDARVYISGCGNFSPAAAPATIWACIAAGCNAPGFWNPTLPFGSDGTQDLIDCYPTQCANQNMTFTINTARGYCAAYTVYDNCNWANSFCVSLDDWSVTVQGRSIETLGNTATGNGTQNIFDADCAGTQTLDPTPLYGVPGYTYSWSTGASTPTITVPGTVSTFTADVTDACGNTVTATFDIGCPLATQIDNFSVIKKDRTAILSWSTLSEVDNDLFVIEKSTDGINWRTLVELEAAENSNEKIDYHYTDLSPASGMNYYRLKYESVEQEFKYSDVKSVKLDYLYNIFPNPATDVIQVQSEQQGTELRVFKIVTILGEIVLSGEFEENSETVNISSLDNGTYFIKILQQGKVVESSRFVKQD